MNTYQFLKQHTRENLGFSFFIALLLYSVGYIILLPSAGIILGLIYGFSTNEFIEIIGGNFEIHPEAENIFRLINGINQLATWGFVGIVMTHLLGTFPGIIGLKRKIPALSVISAIFLLILGLPLVQFFHIDFSQLSVLGTWTEGIVAQEKTSQRFLETLMANPSVSILIFNLVVSAVLPAICEEIFFRGFLQKQFYKLVNRHLAVWLTAFIFSLVHFELPGLFSRMVLAVLLGYFFYSTKSLIPCILAHFFYNAISIMIVYLNGGISTGDNMQANGFPLWISLLSLALVIALLYWYVKRFTQISTPSNSINE